jgi:3-oxoacyl-[acyl-carrier protein] reductase
MDESGRCALVTGASRGIGSAIARQLAGDGWAVAVNYRDDEQGAAETVASILAVGGRSCAIQGDVADPQTADALVAGAEAELGPVLVLVNNAGIRDDGLCAVMTDDEFSSVLETNLTAAFRLTRRVLRRMLRARFGRIVNVGSIVGLRGNPGQVNYAASKAGLVAMTRTVAAEVARRGITANVVAPGLIETAMTATLHQDMAKLIPARRAGSPDEVAACVRFLVSEAAGYVNGATLVVDGALTA